MCLLLFGPGRGGAPSPHSTSSVQDHVAKIVEERATRLGLPMPQPAPDPTISPKDLRFEIYAYICGLNNMVASIRELLSGYGWHRKQVVFERYD